MVSISDLASILDKLPIWKTLKELPARVAELEKRVAELESEEKKSGHPPCAFCHSENVQLQSLGPHEIFGDSGIKTALYVCDDCNNTYEKEIDPFQS